MENKNWSNTSVEEILQEVNTDTGLTSQQAQQKLQTDGLNQLAQAEKESLLIKFINQFKDVMILILIAAAIISGVLGEMVDAFIILAIVVVNALLGLYQEGKAENA